MARKVILNKTSYHDAGAIQEITAEVKTRGFAKVFAGTDPDMMASMPKALTAATGMNALTHTIVGYITKAAWSMSDMFHLKAIEIITSSLHGAIEKTPTGREGMAFGQYIAGIGFL